MVDIKEKIRDIFKDVIYRVCIFIMAFLMGLVVAAIPLGVFLACDAPVPICLFSGVLLVPFWFYALWRCLHW